MNKIMAVAMAASARFTLPISHPVIILAILFQKLFVLLNPELLYISRVGVFFSCHTNRVLYTRLQVHHLKH
jgi:hypothetical protein